MSQTNIQRVTETNEAVRAVERTWLALNIIHSILASPFRALLSTPFVLSLHSCSQSFPIWKQLVVQNPCLRSLVKTRLGGSLGQRTNADGSDTKNTVQGQQGSWVNSIRPHRETVHKVSQSAVKLSQELHKSWQKVSSILRQSQNEPDQDHALSLGSRIKTQRQSFA